MLSVSVVLAVHLLAWYPTSKSVIMRSFQITFGLPCGRISLSGNSLSMHMQRLFF